MTLLNLEAAPDTPGKMVLVNRASVVAVKPYVGGWEHGGIWRALEIQLVGEHSVSVLDTAENRRLLGLRGVAQWPSS